MKALIVYDSVYGNTEQIARAIAEALAALGEVKVVRTTEVDLSELESTDLLIAGCPTHRGRPTPAMQDFLDSVAAPSLRGIKVAAFDTRVTAKIARIFGHAAGRITAELNRKGGASIASPEGFFVTGMQGPLKEGEQERAVAWARGLLEDKG